MDMARPSKFTPERRAAIIDSISHRIPYELAALANGICEETLYAWLRTGIADQKAGIDSEYALFSEAIKSTEQKKIRHHFDKIDANIERWQADAWILERRWYKYFGQNAAVIEFNKRLEQLENQNGKESETVPQDKEGPESCKEESEGSIGGN